MKKTLLLIGFILWVLCFPETSTLHSQTYLYHQQLSFDLGKDIQNFTIAPASDGGYLVAECFNQSWPNPD
ncbi:MAG TPA: hypothetical protein P5228_08140, partial [Bacteroidales bacterium]|nr:hypothetical protein [Bacteroidales bacterium]HRZ49175.1 hypothetical protein [Bacteroidales bacterium]